MGNNQNKGVVSKQVDLSHFKLCRSIGRGSFGKVRIVDHKVNRKQYALKYFSKADLIARKMSKNIIRERNILVNLSHPFICNLRFGFQDDYNIYMVLDLMLGGDLRFHTSRRKFSNDELVLIAAELSSALGYLHSLNIVHRDLKPDNILLDEKGHAHLTDFNIATYVEPGVKLTSHSGTLQYMAPEIVEGQGYDHLVDWWSLGATLYECIYDKTPFQDVLKKSKDKEVILTTEVDWALPTHLNYNCDIVQFTNKLLIRDPSQRLASGHQGSIIVSKLPLFRAIDWELLLKKMIMPPFCPNSQKPNFDMSYDLEELLLENNPLESLPSKRSKKVSKMSADMLYLENSYLPYDFYASTRGRRHSVDYTAEPFPNPSSKPLPALPSKPPCRTSKSCADLHSICKEEGLEDMAHFPGTNSPASTQSSHLLPPSSFCSTISEGSHVLPDPSLKLMKPLSNYPKKPSPKFLHPSIQISPPAPGRLVIRSLSSPTSTQNA